MSGADTGKRVSWVELYLDLIYALAVGQLAHVITDDPTIDSVWVALGLFLVLWWTWIGFAVQYNQQGEDDTRERLLFLLASVPTGAAAVAIGPAAVGDVTAFALAMAAVRLILAALRAVHGPWRKALTLPITRAYLLSAALFAISTLMPEPWRYVVWGVVLAAESGVLLRETPGEARRLRRERDLEALAPTTPGQALDAHHFAERFGLFLIILLGELVISAGESAVEGHVSTAAGWAALVGAMVLAATLWWLYFNAVAEINLRVLQAAGGSPVVARALFAVGHMLPAFALLLMAAGVGLLLDPESADDGYWLCSVGVGTYLIGTRVFFATTSRLGHLARVLLVIATFELGQLQGVVSPSLFIWIVALWTLGCAALATRNGRDVSDETLRSYV